MPDADLYIVGEHFERVRHQLLGLKGAEISDLKRVLSHTQALGQCRASIRKLGIQAIPEADTAGSARIISELGDKASAAIASSLAAEIYGLDTLKTDIEDETPQHHTLPYTRQ